MKLRVAAVAVSGAFGECAYAQPVTISPGSCLQSELTVRTGVTRNSSGSFGGAQPNPR